MSEKTENLEPQGYRLRQEIIYPTIVDQFNIKDSVGVKPEIGDYVFTNKSGQTWCLSPKHFDNLFEMVPPCENNS